MITNLQPMSKAVITTTTTTKAMMLFKIFISLYIKLNNCTVYIWSWICFWCCHTGTVVQVPSLLCVSGVCMFSHAWWVLFQVLLFPFRVQSHKDYLNWHFRIACDAWVSVCMCLCPGMDWHTVQIVPYLVPQVILDMFKSSCDPVQHNRYRKWANEVCSYFKWWRHGWMFHYHHHCPVIPLGQPVSESSQDLLLSVYGGEQR